MSSLAYQEHCRKTYKVCPCGEPATQFMHLKHVGMGVDRKREHWEHYTGVMACERCHRLYDGRLNKESGLKAYYEATGINLVKVAMGRLLDWLPMDQHLSLLKSIAKWI